MPPLRATLFSEDGKDAKCSICKLSEADALNYGEIRKKQELTVHLFCLHFSTGLRQREGTDDSDLDGYGLNDIRTVISNSVDAECCYCHEASATAHCHYPNCGRTFHQPCGFKANARFEYLDSYRSFCDEHSHIESDNLEYPDLVGCYLCYEALEDYNPVTTIPSCCGYWFHQQCLRKYAINACSSFMCPICRNKDYGDFARRHGIYVPKCAALWEATHDYTDIEHFYEHCDANECICPVGRTFTSDEWSLQICSGCGSYGLHKLCRPKTEQEDTVICKDCVNVVSKLQNWNSQRQQGTICLRSKTKKRKTNTFV